MSKNITIAGLDIGTSNIKMIVAQKRANEADFEVLAKANYLAQGIRRGVVDNIEQVAEAISFCLEEAKKQTNKNIDGVFANLNGSHIFCMPSHGLVSVSRADQNISQEDIDRVIQAARTFSFPPNKEILETFPKEFIVDSEKGIKNALGMQGIRLETEVLIIGGFSPYIKNSSHAILSSGLQVNDLIIGSLASSHAVLNQKEKELGVALLDIGAGTTNLAVFEEGDLIHLAVLPIGSLNITNDIAIGLKTDIDTAERIKIEIASLQKNTKKKDKIEKEDLVFSSKTLNNIVESRVVEIFDLVDKELKKISKSKLLPAGVVLTGGGAKLPKINELAKKELMLPCRIGLPIGFFPNQDDPSWSTACGLVLSGFDGEEGFSGFNPFKGVFGRVKKIFKIFMP